jgi:hypothetical protein
MKLRLILKRMMSTFRWTRSSFFSYLEKSGRANTLGSRDRASKWQQFSARVKFWRGTGGSLGDVICCASLAFQLS